MPDKIVNHFVLADGSTAKYRAEQLAGDVPEVVGIRTGYDGTVYDSAGNAVRGQASELRGYTDVLYGDVEGKIPLTLTYEQGAYLVNGFSNSGIRIRAEIDAGNYLFNPSSNIYFSIVYYDTDVSGTTFVNMGSIVKETKLTITRTAWITIQYKNSTAITPSNRDELELYIYKGEPIANMPTLKDSKVAELNNIGASSITRWVTDRVPYYIGEGKEYTTINEAKAKWETDNKPNAVFFVSNGEYNEIVQFNGENVLLLGESRHGTIIRTTTGRYTDAPVHLLNGDTVVENMTLIADHSDAPDFDYETYANPSCAYGLHVDGGTIAGKTVARNCTIVSYQSPAVGSGTIPNATIRLENCDLFSYTDGTTNTNSKQYRVLQYGSLLCHLSSSNGYPTRGVETLELINTRCYLKNGKNVIKLNYGTDTTEKMQVVAINNSLASGVENNRNALFVPDANLVVLSDESQGNTCDSMNKE